MVKILIENTQENNIKKQIKDIIKDIQDKIINQLDNTDDFYTKEVFRNLIGPDYVKKNGELYDFDMLDEEDKEIIQDKLSKKYSNKDVESEIILIYKKVLEDLFHNI